jgi:hypothetical protein
MTVEGDGGQRLCAGFHPIPLNGDARPVEGLWELLAATLPPDAYLSPCGLLLGVLAASGAELWPFDRVISGRGLVME